MKTEELKKKTLGGGHEGESTIDSTMISHFYDAQILFLLFSFFLIFGIWFTRSEKVYIGTFGIFVISTKV